MIRARVTDKYPRAHIMQPIISCRLTDRVSDQDLFFSVLTDRGEEKLTVINQQGNHTYLTGKR